MFILVFHTFLVIITDKTRVKGGRKGEGVGVMKDKEIKLEEIEVSHTLKLSDTLKPNGHSGTDTRTGVRLHNKPTDLSVSFIGFLWSS